MPEEALATPPISLPASIETGHHCRPKDEFHCKTSGKLTPSKWPVKAFWDFFAAKNIVKRELAVEGTGDGEPYRQHTLALHLQYATGRGGFCQGKARVAKKETRKKKQSYPPSHTKDKEGPPRGWRGSGRGCLGSGSGRQEIRGVDRGKELSTKGRRLYWFKGLIFWSGPTEETCHYQGDSTCSDGAAGDFMPKKSQPGCRR